VQHFIDLSTLDRPSKERLLETASEMIPVAGTRSDIAAGRILATLFYEPSTRTRLSFESAMLRLGGQWLGFADVKAASVAKGESLADTIRTVDKYADIIAIRHPAEGAALAASLYSDVPIINAGDGGHFHPSQTLLDMLTIRQELGRLGGLTIVLVGDLRYGRTASSLALAMADFRPHVITVTPDGLELPRHIYRRLRVDMGVNVTETSDLKEAAEIADVLYVTRIQRERFFSDEEYQEVKGSYVVDERLVAAMPPGSLVLHPLPRVDEIAVEVDNSDKARYFKQMFYGVPARMALIAILLELKEVELEYVEPDREVVNVKCGNARCVTKTEPYLPRYFSRVSGRTDPLFGGEGAGVYRCSYCDYEVGG
jgi:aspartate carbamoyltransferase catalytic subunit